MSLIHRLSAGHFAFAPQLDAPTWFTVVRPLDPAAVAELVARHADDGRVDAPTFDGAPMTWRDGYVTGPWWAGPRVNAAFVAFARALHARTGCALAELHGRRVVDARALAEPPRS